MSWPRLQSILLPSRVSLQLRGSRLPTPSLAPPALITIWSSEVLAVSDEVGMRARGIARIDSFSSSAVRGQRLRHDGPSQGLAPRSSGAGTVRKIRRMAIDQLVGHCEHCGGGRRASSGRRLACPHRWTRGSPSCEQPFTSLLDLAFNCCPNARKRAKLKTAACSSGTRLQFEPSLKRARCTFCRPRHSLSDCLTVQLLGSRGSHAHKC